LKSHVLATFDLLDYTYLFSLPDICIDTLKLQVKKTLLLNERRHSLSTTFPNISNPMFLIATLRNLCFRHLYLSSCHFWNFSSYHNHLGKKGTSKTFPSQKRQLKKHRWI